MKISDVELGKASRLEVVNAEDENFEYRFVRQQAVSLLPLEDSTESALLRVGDNIWTVRGRNTQHHEQLGKLTQRNFPHLAWILQSTPAESATPTSVLIDVREFPSELYWPDKIEIGIDDRTLDDIRKRLNRQMSIQQATAFLEERVLIDVNGETMILLSGAPAGARSALNNAFRLHGQGVILDVSKNKEGGLAVNRVQIASPPKTTGENKPVVLVRGQFHFVNVTQANILRGSSQIQLDQIISENGSYLKIWQEYNKLERDILSRRAREFGWLQYSSCKPMAEGSWRFQILGAEGISYRFAELQNEESTLEASAMPPRELQTPLAAAKTKPSEKNTKLFAGVCTGVDSLQNTVDIRSIRQDIENDATPPQKGFICLSLSGDKIRLNRREIAQAQIASAQCPMPQLGLLMEGRPVSQRRSRQITPLSPEAVKLFGGTPTERQKEALRVALNTPDIALIQGPPGTGKTRVIAALQTRLSELASDTKGIAASSLLTSYQHDAVENVANATKVFELPTIKVGHRRYQQDRVDNFELWRQDSIEAVQAELAALSELPVAVAYGRCRDLVVTYFSASVAQEDVPSLLKNIQDYASIHITANLLDKLVQARDTAGTLQALEGTAEEQAQILAALRRVRVDTASFCDDGAKQAYRALDALKHLALSDEERDLLTAASDWEDGEPLDFLEDLKKFQECWIDKLLSMSTPRLVPAINADIESLLTAVLEALKLSMRRGREGIGATLHQFKDDLEMDPEGVKRAVERYAVVVAATCQQAVGHPMGDIKGGDIVFETVVVDEAARANPLDLAIPMSLAERRIILVGDHRQLPHLLEHEVERDLTKTCTEKTHEMLQRSLFERLFQIMQEREKTDGVKRTVTLDVQYRMHPVLGDFVSDVFYKPHGETFVSGREASEFNHDIKNYEQSVAAWVNIPLGKGAESRGQSKARSAEAQWIAKETKRILEARPDFSVGVITFYSAQVSAIKEEMEKIGLMERADDESIYIAPCWRTTSGSQGGSKERLRVGTVDAFQGMEFDVVLLSMTRSNKITGTDESSLRKKYGHLMLENRLCVAMSRQQRLLVVVGDADMLRHESAVTSIPSLVRFYELCGGEHGCRI